MKNVKTLSVFLLTLGVLLPAMSLPARAGEVEGEVVPAVQWYADEDKADSAKFEEYRDVPNGFVLERLRVNWEASDQFYLNLEATDITQDDQRIDFQIGDWDTWKIVIDWRENPRRFSDSAKQIHTYHGDGVYEIPDAVQDTLAASADRAGDFGDYVDQSAYDVGLGYQRKTGSFTFEATPTEELTVGVTAERERREGTAPTVAPGYAFAGIGGYEVAFPIDYKTDTTTGYVEYATELFSVGGRYTYSEFESEQDRLYWENPLIPEGDDPALAPPSSMNQLDPADDNQMTQWVVYGAGNLPGRTRVSATFSQGNIENDEVFLPLTVNPTLAAAAPPGSLLGGQRFDGEYDTALYDIRLSGRPTTLINWKAWWRQYELDNKTGNYEVEYVAADDHAGETRSNLNYGYERTSYGALLGFSPTERLDVGLQYERVGWDREESAVEDTDEDTWKLYLDLLATDWLNLRASYRRQERESDHWDDHWVDHYTFPHGEAPGAANLGSRAYMWSDRDRNSFDLSFEVTPKPVFSIYGEARWWESDYMDPNTGQDIGTHILEWDERRVETFPDPITGIPIYPGEELYSLLLAGRSEDEGNSYTLGFSVQPGSNFRLFADYTWEEYEYTVWSRYRGRSSALNGGAGAFGDDIVDVDISQEATWTDWFSENEDEYRTFSLGFQATLPNDQWDVYGSILYHEGESNYGQHIADNPFDEHYGIFPPGTESELTIAKLQFDYHARQNLTWGFGWWYEKWEEADWQFDYTEPYMGRAWQDPGNADGNFSSFLGTDFEDYENHVLMVNMRYSF